jgi:hypothetical protein
MSNAIGGLRDMETGLEFLPHREGHPGLSWELLAQLDGRPICGCHARSLDTEQRGSITVLRFELRKNDMLRQFDACMKWPPFKDKPLVFSNIYLTLIEGWQFMLARLLVGERKHGAVELTVVD